MINLTIMSFFAGLLTFISPCILPLIPAYIFYITGLKVDSQNDNRKDYIINVLLFILGFSIVFITLGILTSLLFFLAKNIKFYLNIIFGIIIVIFGLHISGVIKLFFLNQQKKFDFTKIKINSIGSLFMGMAFASGWSPCVGPILATILGLVAIQGSILKGIVFLLIYSIGLGLPFFITALFFNYMKPLLDFFKKHSNIIKIISGIFIIIIGILIIFGSLNLINIYLLQFSYFLENHNAILNYILSFIIMAAGLSILTIMFLNERKIKVIPFIVAGILITFAIIIMLNLINPVNYIIAYLRYTGI
jgi:cytochrome c-type biogenesis protein